MTDLQTVTRLLLAWRDGDRAAFDRLVPLVYKELRQLARHRLRRERSGHTLRPTELVAEAYLRLAAAAPASWNDRTHFFAVAARSMRHVLVDHARKRNRGKRGAGWQAVELEDGLIDASQSDELLGLEEALQALAQVDERKVRVVELHYFGGLSQDRIAAMLGVHTSTVARDLRFAEAWVHRRLRAPDRNQTE